MRIVGNDTNSQLVRRGRLARRHSLQYMVALRCEPEFVQEPGSDRFRVVDAAEVAVGERRTGKPGNVRIGERRGLGVPVRSQRGGQVIALGDIEIDAFSQLVSVIGETALREKEAGRGSGNQSGFNIVLSHGVDSGWIDNAPRSQGWVWLKIRELLQVAHNVGIRTVARRIGVRKVALQFSRGEGVYFRTGLILRQALSLVRDHEEQFVSAIKHFRNQHRTAERSAELIALGAVTL